jgi:hypothetical protein
MLFLHKDEWEQQYDRKDELPAVLLETNGEISIWIDVATMNRLDLSELKGLIVEKLGMDYQETATSK